MGNRYEVRRTLLVRPCDYGLPFGSLLCTAVTAAEAVWAAQSWTRLGYPARVVDAAAQVVVWVRP